jgi:hypothetical protein
VDTRHLIIKQDQVRVEALGRADGIGPVLGERELVIIGRQRQTNKLSNSTVVVDEEYAWPGHHSIRSPERDVRVPEGC